jgi:hypothetical protein
MIRELLDSGEERTCIGQPCPELTRNPQISWIPQLRIERLGPSSVQEYVLVGSTYKTIEVYRRENGWRPYHYREGDLVELKSLGVSFPFDALYRRIPM